MLHKTIEKRLKVLQEKDPIRIKGILRKRKEDKLEFVMKLLSIWNLNRPTIFANSPDIIQTQANCRRSLGDIYQICLYYYPDFKLEELTSILHHLVYYEDSYRTSYCYTIKKRVFYYDETKDRGIFDEDEIDEYGNFYYEFYDNQVNDAL